MNTQVKLFGVIADTAGEDEIIVSDIMDTDSLKKKMIADFPKLEDLSFSIAVSRNIISGNQKIAPGDTVALLPPFAGG